MNNIFKNLYSSKIETFNRKQAPSSSMFLLCSTCILWSLSTLQPYFTSPDSMCISPLWKSPCHPCGLVTSIGINLSLWKSKKTGKQSAFWLTTWSMREIIGVKDAETEVWREPTLTHPRDPLTLQSRLLLGVLPCSSLFCNTTGWAWQRLTATLEVTVIMECIKWKGIRLWWSTLAFCLVEEWVVSW